MRRRALFLLALVVAACAAFAIDLGTGPSGLGWREAVRGLWDSATLDGAQSAILWEVRLPQGLLAVLVGAALAFIAVIVLPTSALDLRHQLQVMGIAREVAKAGSTVIVVLHDLQVAARWADALMVMKDGELYAAGSAADTMTSVTIREVYGVDATVERTPSGELHIGSFQPTS